MPRRPRAAGEERILLVIDAANQLAAKVRRKRRESERNLGTKRNAIASLARQQGIGRAAAAEVSWEQLDPGKVS
jgi:hypothetical protein